MHAMDARDVRVALVTGGAIRVGRGIVEHLVDIGFSVWVHAHRSEDEAKALVASTPGAIGPVIADLCDEAARAELVQRILDPAGPAAGRIDVLVNSAAGFEHGDFEQRSDADLRRVLELNLVAPVSLLRQLLPALRSGPGAVVNIVDETAHHPWAGYLDHGLSKTALAMATRALAVELAPVRVNAVSPGTVDWPTGPGWEPGGAARKTTVARIPAGTIGRPQDVAEAVGFLATAAHVSGQVLAVDGGRLAAIAGPRPDARGGV